jgi:ketosteroid isomerase-like protein
MNTIPELEDKWVAAELNGDAAALDPLLADDFRVVGPLGFVLDKQQWLDRYRDRALHNDEVAWDDGEIRTHGDAAVAIGRWTQRGDHQGHRIDGTFRVTQGLVRKNGEWALSGVHLSPIATPGERGGSA